jgi:hypothetical protein
MCELAQVSRAGFYRDWQEQQPREAEVASRDSIQKAAPHRQYGYRRVNTNGASLRGARVARRILKSDNLLAVGKRKFKATTDSAHGVHKPCAVPANKGDQSTLGGWLTLRICACSVSSFIWMCIEKPSGSRLKAPPAKYHLVHSAGLRNPVFEGISPVFPRRNTLSSEVFVGER